MDGSFARRNADGEVVRGYKLMPLEVQFDGA
jgi:hypothetical protein